MALIKDMPELFGYYSTRPGVPAYESMSMRERFEIFAEREGFDLTKTYPDPEAEPGEQFQAMIALAQRREIRAVVIFTLTDLGTDPETQKITRKEMENAGLRVLILAGGAV